MKSKKCNLKVIRIITSFVVAIIMMSGSLLVYAADTPSYMVSSPETNNMNENQKDLSNNLKQLSVNEVQAFAEGYPKLGAPRPDGSKSVDIIIKTVTGGAVYFVVLPDGADAPTGQQIMSRTDAAGNAPIMSVGFFILGNTETPYTIYGTLDNNTNYDVYFVAKDSNNNLSDVKTLNMITPPEIKGPNFVQCVLSEDNSKITVELDEGIYSNGDGTGAVTIEDFNFYLDSNGGTVTGITVNSIKNTSGGDLVGGECDIVIQITPHGIPSGIESLWIRPKDESSIYSINGTPMNADHSTALPLSDKRIPEYVLNYPNQGAIQSYGSRQVEILVQADEDGTAYYVVLEAGSAFPNASQIASSKDSIDKPAIASGSGNIIANNISGFITTKLPYSNMDYDAFVVVKDQHNNYSEVAKITIRTPQEGNNFNYTITFNSMGGSPVINQVIPEGGILIKPEINRDGYRFIGWYKDADYINMWDFTNDRVIDHITLYAKWERILEDNNQGNDGNTVNSDNTKVSRYKDEIQKISANPQKKTLYIGGTTDKSVSIQINIPEILTEKISNGQLIKEIAYQSSNPSVAKISKSGKITAYKEGNATITTTLTVDGITLTFISKITVKKAYIKIRKQKSSMKLGEIFTFSVKCFGFKEDDIKYTTKKKGRIVISKTGKAKAKTKGTDYVVIQYNNKVKQIKVTVN